MQAAEETREPSDPRSGEPVEQREDQMWLRNVLHAGSRIKEVIVYVKGLEELDFIGFICGMDEEWIQLCLTKDQSLVLIDRGEHFVLHVTPHTLSEYQRDHVLSERQFSRIRQMCSPFRDVCNAVLQGKDDSTFPVFAAGENRIVPESSIPAQGEDEYDVPASGTGSR